MTRYELGGIPATESDTADRLTVYLEGKGYAVASLSTGYSPQTGLLYVIADTDRDPLEDLRAYVSTPTPTETTRAAMITATKAQVRALRELPEAVRTPHETLLLGLAATLPEFANDATK